MRLFVITLSAACLLGISGSAHAAITFGTGDYDNTLNVVNSGPTPVNNQTTGLFRDVFWYNTNNLAPRVGSPDYINAGANLISNGAQSAPYAIPGGQWNALNFTGPGPSGQTYMTVYDTTPGDGTTTRNTFDASVVGGMQVSADVLFTPGQHTVSAGVMAMYNGGQDALALLARNGGGNNPDHASLDLVWTSALSGGPIVLLDTSTPSDAFPTLPSSAFLPDTWYRITMGLLVSGNQWTMNGVIQAHVTGSNPTSALVSTPITSLTYTGLLANPSPNNSQDGTRVLTNPGEVGIVVVANESLSGLGNPPPFNNPQRGDNVGVSVTNFAVGGGGSADPHFAVPEPASLAVWALLGAAVLCVRRRPTA